LIEKEILTHYTSLESKKEKTIYKENKVLILLTNVIAELRGGCGSVRSCDGA
jgi:hypothetical protein